MSESTRKRSGRHEKRIARRMTEAGLDTRTTVNSGAKVFDTGDGVNDLLLFEAKLRGGKGFRVTSEMLEKLDMEASFTRAGGRIPVLPFCLESYKPRSDWYIIEDYHFYNLLRRMLEAEDRAEKLEDSLKDLLAATTAEDAKNAIKAAKNLLS